MFAGGVCDAEGRVDTYSKEVLEDGGEKDGVAVVEKGVGSALVAASAEVIRFGDIFGKKTPILAGGFGFFVDRAAIGEFLDPFEARGLGSKFSGEGGLVLAFGVDRFLPEPLAELRFEVDLSTGEKSVSGAVGGEDKGGGFEVFADDKTNAVFGGLEEEIGVDGGGEGGDYNGGNVFDGERFGSFIGAASELTVFAGEGASGSVDADDVVGHGG